jgi:UTP--glucose-1-phosphate uridylyltransferase
MTELPIRRPETVADTSQNDPKFRFIEKMTRAGMPKAAKDTFALHLDRYLAGETGTIIRDQLIPIGETADLATEGASPDIGRESLHRTIVIKLNGGLGTGMGLQQAKSLIEVRPGRTFLDLIVRQIQTLRRQWNSPVPLVFMNSYRTEADTTAALERHLDLTNPDLPRAFLQSQAPKVLTDGQTPATWPADPDLEWCPPGHGDLYTSLATSGILHRLVAGGYEFAFVSNSDNLGAVLDIGLLGHMVQTGADFMMEVADRTPADRKGGHLCRLKDGRLALRESAQCPPEEAEEFQDINRYRFFNTNNLWFSLSALADLLDHHQGVLPLDTIVNHKTLDPRDPESPRVVQLESAMGAAISLFDHATAIRVPRSRFSPVKNTNDLLTVRSDAFELTDDSRVVLASERSAPPTVRLDPRFFTNLDDFDRRFPSGPPSLVGCTSLTVHGDVTFGEGVVVEGDVAIRGGDDPSRIPDGAVLRSSHRA